MQYELTDSFVSDFKKLKPEHKAMFKKVVRERFAQPELLGGGPSSTWVLCVAK